VGDQPERRRSVLNDFLLRKRLDAVIAVALVLSDAEIQQLLAVHRPIVGIGGALPGASTIRIDDERLARMATDHLIRLGHTLIAHVTGDAALNQDFKLPGIRQGGYQKAMTAAGLDDTAGMADHRGFHRPGRVLSGSPPFGQRRRTANGCLRGI
jgi:DNA-binding LacI/PurR family transcriptional regulator